MYVRNKCPINARLDLKITRGYLHSTEKTIRNIGQKISEAREEKEAEQEQKEKPKSNIVQFRVS
jgi:hypothetical protein